jgi:putative chitinase
VNHPELLEQPRYALLSALWFWKKNSLNKYADRDAYTELTKRINGGTNGLPDRLEWLRKANKYINTL